VGLPDPGQPLGARPPRPRALRRILVSAEPDTLPHSLVEQLADNGRLVIPVAGTMLLVVRSGHGVKVTEHGHYRFVALR